MPSAPHLHLTHGQVAWSLCGGQIPDQRTLDLLRYLRKLGIPFTEEEQGIGHGNRLTYKFDHLIECAVALYAIRRGMKPRHAAPYLESNRKELRKTYRRHFTNMADDALEAPWVKSHGKVKVVDSNEEFIRLHERYSDTSGKVEMMTMDEVVTFNANMADLAERYADVVYPLVPIRRVMTEAVAWARVAPVTRPGRPASKPDS